MLPARADGVADVAGPRERRSDASPRRRACSTTTACCSTPRRRGRAPRSRCSRRHGADVHARAQARPDRLLARGRRRQARAPCSAARATGAALMAELHALVMEEAPRGVEPMPGRRRAARRAARRRHAGRPSRRNSPRDVRGADAARPPGCATASPSPSPATRSRSAQARARHLPRGCAALGADPARCVGARGLADRRRRGPRRRAVRHRRARRCRASCSTTADLVADVAGRSGGPRAVRPRTLSLVAAAPARGRHRRLLRRRRASSSRASPTSAGARCCSGCCSSALYLTLRSRAYFNVLRAAYPAERFQWRRIWGAYVAGVRLQQRRARPRRRRHQAVPGQDVDPELDLPGGRRRRSSSRRSSTRRSAILVLIFAFTQGVFPKPPDFSKLNAFDLSLLRRRTRASAVPAHRARGRRPGRASRC